MPKLILTTEAQGKVAYEFSETSITIGRAPVALAFLGSMVAVLMMRAP